MVDSGGADGTAACAAGALAAAAPEAVRAAAVALDPRLGYETIPSAAAGAAPTLGYATFPSAAWRRLRWGDAARSACRATSSAATSLCPSSCATC